MNLTDFLLARIAEDEAVARGAYEIAEQGRSGVRWHWVTDETDEIVKPGEIGLAREEQRVSLRTVEEEPTSVGLIPEFVLYVDDFGPLGAPEHIARHDPARVLAECEAKRRIVELHEISSYPTVVNPSDGPSYEEDEKSCAVCGWCEWACETVRLLALPYADHPDYDPAWRA